VTAAALEKKLLSLGDPTIAAHSARFFKSGPGEYAEGQQIIGVRVPALRQLVKEQRTTITLPDALTLLKSPWHEVRLFALLAMVELYQRGDDKQKPKVVNAYLKHKKYINNWDLVDSSAYKITGAWYYDKDRSPLHKLVPSKHLWSRRIAILSTFYYIRQNDLDDTYKYSRLLLNDSEDLMHKACGWMLREAGKRDTPRLEDFLQQHGSTMPRIMLRYAIEKLPTTKRKKYMSL